MLHVYFGRDTIEKGFVWNPDKYFDYNFEREWFSNPDVIQMVKDIDDSDVIAEGIIDSPYLGLITPKDLSGGVKTLIMMLMTDKHFNGTACGNNCAKWILKIAQEKELFVNFRHIMDFGFGEFKIHILNNDTYVTNMLDFFIVAEEFLGGE